MKRCNRKTGFTLVELLVVIGIIALLISILLPSLNRARETSNRVVCASNLRQIGQAILLYANENKGSYPRTFYKAGAPLAFSDDASDGGTLRDPFGNKGVAGKVGDNEVLAGVFLLIRTQD